MNKIQPPADLLCAYILGEENTEVARWLESAAADKPHWKIIDSLRKASTGKEQPGGEIHFDTIEEMVETFCRGGEDDSILKRFKASLESDPQNCQKLLIKLNQYDDLVNASSAEKPMFSKEALLSIAGFGSKDKPGNVIGKIPSAVWYALSAAAVLLVVFLTQPKPDASWQEAYRFGGRVPLDYDGSALRGSMDTAAPDSNALRFYYAYREGLTHYLAAEYNQAHEAWKPLKPLAAAQVATSEGSVADEYLLYYGVNLIALSQQSNAGLTDEQRQQLRDEAFEALNQSRFEPHASRYFMGLARALNGRSGEALDLLNSIDPESRFGGRAKELTRTLTEDR